MTGLQPFGKLQTDHSRLPVIAITGRSNSSLKQQIAYAGAFAFLEKPMGMWTIESAAADSTARGLRAMPRSIFIRAYFAAR